uniref:Uncharacterized protein n=1 Tax=Rhizophora mucronata TaxID=61149 RepID=A0A2P2QKH9_RHIMU
MDQNPFAASGLAFLVNFISYLLFHLAHIM